MNAPDSPSNPRAGHTVVAPRKPGDFLPVVRELQRVLQQKLESENRELDRKEMQARSRYSNNHERLNVELYEIEEQRKILKGSSQQKLFKNSENLMKFLESLSEIEAAGTTPKDVKDLNQQVADLTKKNEHLTALLDIEKKLPKPEDIDNRLKDVEEREEEVRRTEETLVQEAEKLDRQRQEADRGVDMLAKKELDLDNKRDLIQEESESLEKMREANEKDLRKKVARELQKRAMQLILKSLNLDPKELKGASDTKIRKRRASPKTTPRTAVDDGEEIRFPDSDGADPLAD